MRYIFQNCSQTTTVEIDVQKYPNAYLYINKVGLSFEFLDRDDLDNGRFTYDYNDFVVSVKSDVVTVWSSMAHFDRFVDDIREYVGG